MAIVATNETILIVGEGTSGHSVALDAADTTGPIVALENCVAYERTIEPGTWARLLSILG